MPKFKKTNFRAGVKANTEKQKNAESNYGYLRLPKSVHIFNIDKEGKYDIDFLPYIVSIPNHPDKEGDVAAKDTLWYRMPFKVHKNVGDENDAVVCPTTFGQKCPICEYKKKRAAEGADKDELKALNPTRRSLYAVIPKAFGKNKINEEEAIFVFDYSEFLFQKNLNDELQEDDANAVFPDLEEGLTLRIRFEEETFNKNKFYSTGRIDFVERDGGYDESILDEVPVLDKLLIVLPYAEIEAKFFGIDMEDVDTTPVEEVAEPAPSGRRRQSPPAEETPAPPSHRRTPAPEPEPEPEEQDEIPEEDRCVACGGTGKTSRGGVCPICDGTGLKPIQTPAPKPRPAPVAEPAPVRRAPAPKVEANKCPSGHVWGADCDRKKECEICTSWNECSEA